MNSLESPVTKKIYGSASDIISNVPDAVLESILTRMPLRDAVRTSVLSNKWRYSWAKLQQLVFDDTLCQGQTIHKKLIIIYQVLSRIQTVQKFCLSIPLMLSCPEIDNLIIGLSSTQIEEFTLHIWQGGNPHKLPLSLFSYKKLSHLDLLNCVFSPSETFRGFSKLVSLELVEVSITEESFVRLISGFPLLETLKFHLCQDTTYGPIEIDSPSLKTLRFVGTFRSICFKNASYLATVSLCLREGTSQVELYQGDFFYLSLPALENLELDGHYIQSLSAGLERFKGKAENLIPRHLKNLELHGLRLAIRRHRGLTFLLMWSPNLQVLNIQLCPSSHDVQGQIGVELLPECFEKLQDVRVDSVIGTRTELEFLKNILGGSPVLEKMVIKPHPMVRDKGFKILKELSRCERMSLKAKIII